MGARSLPDLPVNFFGEPKKGPLFAAQKAGRQADGSALALPGRSRALDGSALEIRGESNKKRRKRRASTSFHAGGREKSDWKGIYTLRTTF